MTSKSHEQIPLDRLLHSVRNVAPSEPDFGVGGRQCGDSFEGGGTRSPHRLLFYTLPPTSTSTRRSDWLRSCTHFRSLPSTWHRCQSRCMPLYAATSSHHEGQIRPLTTPIAAYGRCLPSRFANSLQVLRLDAEFSIRCNGPGAFAQR